MVKEGEHHEDLGCEVNPLCVTCAALDPSHLRNFIDGKNTM